MSHTPPLDIMHIDKIPKSPLSIFERPITMPGCPLFISLFLVPAVLGLRAEIRPSNYHEGPQGASQYIQISNHVEKSEPFSLKASRSVDDALISLHREGTISLDKDTDIYVHSCDNWDFLVRYLAKLKKNVVILYSDHAQECRLVFPPHAIPGHITYFSLVGDEEVLKSFKHEIKDGAEYQVITSETSSVLIDCRNNIMMICLIVLLVVSMTANLIIAALGCCGRLLWKDSAEKKTEEAVARIYARQAANPPRCTDPNHRSPCGSYSSEEINVGLLPQYTYELKTPNYN
ncbi:hypothetical protein NEOLI_004810 [Neolecta irregularis DAH-3]|uniref:Uncharacterized protein n=1 Tax=Neolecta irregularis (strain DAH-3) TaxID=1198029 RepID=A0A1U7LLS5_NEOID|nr:hypothetical protein NEOLI_004810 [Neolecta irregularis DAH-3]|eukprot:OLL23492.1 hypothetical protein NEOLI_004810 [Neolecta irregularis DAH-3]